MPSEQPLLTIAIPTYNCAQYLRDSIGSVLRQGLDDFEILVMDNASEDNTEDLVRSFENSRIRYIRNPSNLGSRENGNLCLRNSRGRYVKIFCADDVLLDGVLEKQLKILETMPDVALVSCDHYVTNEYLQINCVFPAFPGIHPGSRVIDASLSGVINCIGGPSNVMFRRQEVEGILADKSYSALADWKFYLQILQRGGYANIGDVGYLYRVHPTSDTQANCPVNLRISEHMRLVSEFGGWNALSCFRAVRIAGSEGWRAVGRHWREACTVERIAMAIRTFPDVVCMSNRWHFAQKERASQLGAKFTLENQR